MKKLYLFSIILVILAVIFFIFLVFVDSSDKGGPEIISSEKEVGIESSPDKKNYIHPRLGFSFEKPEGFTVGVSEEGGGEVLVVQTKKPKEGFQIFISPLSQAIELTPDFIMSDLPGTLVENAKKILLDSKANGIIFESNNESFGGGSYEIWFIYSGYIYQITSYLEFSDQLNQIIGTWRFN